MKKILCEGLFLGAVLLLPVAQAAEPNFKPGLWEMTIQTEIPGLPMKPPSETQRHCISKEDLVPPPTSPDKRCKMTNRSLKGNSLVWDIHCVKGKATMSGHGEMVYAGDSVKGQVDMTMHGGPSGDMKITQLLSGRRVGACAK